MLSSVEQAFVRRDERRAPLKMPAWEASVRIKQARSQKNVTGTIFVDIKIQRSNICKKEG